MTKWLRLLLSASCVFALICFTISSASFAKKAFSDEGVNEGKRFTVDGKVGLNPEQTTEPDKPVAATEANPLTPDQLFDPAVIEKFVRRSFQLDMEAKQKRITEAEEELAKIKARYAKRQESAEQLIQERIAALVSNDTASESKEATAQVAAKAEGEDVDDPTSKGWRLWHSQNWDEALRMFKIAVKRYPESGQAWNGLGWTHVHLGQPELAKTAFEKTLEIDPKNGGARNGLGRILMAMGKLDDAEKELLCATQEIIDQYGEEQAITQGITASWFGLIEVKLMKKDFVGAKEWAIRYLQHKPDEKQVTHWLNQAKAKTP